MGLALYGAIASLLGVRLGWAYIRMAGIGASARRQPGLGDDVWVTPAAIPPLTWGRRILVPQSLVSDLPLANLSLIVRHEREHLRRGDPLWFAALAWIDVLAWFNPFIRHQTARCRLAAELACDAAVTAALPDMRQIYAETLVIALKHAAGNVLAYAPAAFSNAQSGDYRMRIMQIMRPSHDGRKPRRLLFAAIAVLALPAAFAQYAWSQAPAATAEKPADTVTVFPVSGRISSGFGPRIHPITKEPSFHSGIDFAVHEGTEVHSIAAGTVSFAGEREGYHQVVEIDHGGGLKTRYAQLGSVRVKAGDKVKVDRVVATSGAYGTGPHLHFEVWQDAKPVDPYAVLNPESSSAFNMNWSADEMAFAGDVRLQKGDRTLMADELRVRR
ncbi:M23/M56 family metallopeptidase [Asticcacaulis biprosthecium]|nr:M23/M56 family metallopeptidase [Asticcacaulis biprosthecium]